MWSLKKVERAWNNRLIYGNTCLDSKNPQNTNKNICLNLSSSCKCLLSSGEQTPKTMYIILKLPIELTAQVTEESQLYLASATAIYWLQRIAEVALDMGWYFFTLWKFWAFHRPSHSVIRNYLTESSELEGIHREHQVQLFSEWLMQGSNLQPWCSLVPCSKQLS